MSNFLLLYITKKGSDESGDDSWDPWMKWKEDMGDSIIDFGAPLGNGKNVSGGSPLSSEKDITGYSIIQADDMDSALKLIENHPMKNYPGGEIEIYEAMGM